MHVFSNSLWFFLSRFLEDVLCYINTVAQSVEENADTATAKFWRALLNKSYDMLDKVSVCSHMKNGDFLISSKISFVL